MKKKLSLLLALVAMLLICCMAVGCAWVTDDPEADAPEGKDPSVNRPAEDDPSGGGSQKHEHNFVYHSTVAASCEADGYTYYCCYGCGSGEKRDTVKSTGHNFGEYQTKDAPTFFAEGSRYRVCGSCDEEDWDTLPKLSLTLTYSVEDGLTTLTVDYGCDGAFDWRVLDLDPDKYSNLTVLGDAVDFDQIDVLVFGDGVTKLSSDGCKLSGESLVAVVFSEDIRYVGAHALSLFSSVEKIYFEGDAPELGYLPFTKKEGTPAVVIPTEGASGFTGIVFGDLMINRPWIECPEVDLFALTLGEYAKLASREAVELAEKVLQMFRDKGQESFALLPYEEDIEKYKLIREFTLELTKDCSTERERVDAIYDWIVGNVVYDDTAVKYEPYQVLSTRRAVCAGYVTLMHDMLCSLDIVSFYTRGSTLFGNMATVQDVFENRDSMESHAWLAICLSDGTVSFCDPTWGVMNREDYRDMSAEELGEHAVAFEVDGLEVMVDGADFTMFTSEGFSIRFIYEDGYIYAAEQGNLCKEESSTDYFNYWFSEAYLLNSSSSNYRCFERQPLYSAHTDGIITSKHLMGAAAFARADGRVFRLIRVLDFVAFRNEVCGDSISLENEFVVEKDGMLFNCVDGKLGLICYFGSASGLTVPATVCGMPVTEISQQAFYSNSVIERVVFENGIEKIWVGAFYNNPNLRYVYLPASVRYATNDRNLPEDRFGGCSIGFERCPMIQQIEVDPDNPELASFQGNLYSKDMAELIFVSPQGSSGVFTLPSCVEYIANRAFAYSRIEGIVFHQGSVYVGEFAFMYSDITEVTLPKGVSIGRYAFAFADRLHTVVLEMGHTAVTYSAFANCNSLINVTLPSSLRTIEEFAFNLCTRLYSIAIPEGVLSIEPYAFVDTPLVSVTLPSTLQSIGDDAFLGCNRLFVVNNLSSLPLTAGNQDYGGVAYSAIEINLGTVDNSNIYLTDEGLVFYNNGSVNILVEYVAMGETMLVLPEQFMGSAYVLVDKAFADFAVSGWDTMDMFDIDCWAAEITHSGDDVTKLVIPSTIITIPDYAFAGWEALEYICYGGTAEQWQSIEQNLTPVFSPELLSAAVVFYSADEPTDVTDGAIFWRYVDGVPTLW